LALFPGTPYYRAIITTLKDVLRNRETSSRIGKWAAELNEYVIDFIHRTTIQSQALADFVADWTPTEQNSEAIPEDQVWQVFCDGSWKYSGAVAATVIHSPSGVKTSYAAKLEFDSTNNVAEYKAIIPELRKLKAMGVKRAILMSDSQVITGHVEKTAKAKEERLEKYLQTIRRMEAHFEGFTVRNITRPENEEADAIAQAAASGAPLPPEVFYEVLRAPSIELQE